MLKRTVCFESAAHLSFKNGQLVYTPKPEGEVRTVPVEDIGFVVLDNHSITLSLRLIEELTANNAAIVFCDKLHHPTAMSVPFDGNTTHAETLAAQLEMSEPLKKQLWKQTVEVKIKNQAAMLQRTESGGVEALAADVSRPSANQIPMPPSIPRTPYSIELPRQPIHTAPAAIAGGTIIFPTSPVKL